MKTLLFIVAFLGLSSAALQTTKLNYRNVYKPSYTQVAQKPKPHIIGGQEAVPHSIPYQAYVEVYSIYFQGWICGGSLLSENYIVTAGHCGNLASIAVIVLGAHKPQEPEVSQVIIYTTDIFIHPDFDSGLLINDIAVIKFPLPVTFDDTIRPVALPSFSDGNDYAGQIAKISGFGLTDGHATSPSEVLNYVEVEVITNEECELAFGPLEASIICTSGKNNTGGCDGDSGGPLAIYDTLIGIVSFGMAYCPGGSPTAFTRVTSFLDFLIENTDVEIR